MELCPPFHHQHIQTRKTLYCFFVYYMLYVLPEVPVNLLLLSHGVAKNLAKMPKQSMSAHAGGIMPFSPGTPAGVFSLHSRDGNGNHSDIRSGRKGMSGRNRHPTHWRLSGSKRYIPLFPTRGLVVNGNGASPYCIQA